jgi:hypothetical protein
VFAQAIMASTNSPCPCLSCIHKNGVLLADGFFKILLKNKIERKETIITLMCAAISSSVNNESFRKVRVFQVEPYGRQHAMARMHHHFKAFAIRR